MMSPPNTARKVTERQRELDDAEEDRLDAEEARAALAEFRASGEKSISIDDVLAEDGLTRADLPG